jgi:hypothetical protein
VWGLGEKTLPGYPIISLGTFDYKSSFFGNIQFFQIPALRLFVKIPVVDHLSRPELFLTLFHCKSLVGPGIHDFIPVTRYPRPE